MRVIVHVISAEIGIAHDNLIRVADVQPQFKTVNDTIANNHTCLALNRNACACSVTDEWLILTINDLIIGGCDDRCRAWRNEQKE